MKGFAVCVNDSEFVNWQGLLVDKLEYALVVKDDATLAPIAANIKGAVVVPVEAPDKEEKNTQRGTYFEYHLAID
jgi:hypothetical protein